MSDSISVYFLGLITLKEVYLIMTSTINSQFNMELLMQIKLESQQNE